MSKKYTKEELLKIPAIEVYKLVLRKEIGRFPSGFFMQSEAKENAKLCIKFMMEEILKWTDDEEIKEKLSYKIFRENKLGGMLPLVFNNRPYEAINEVYPNRFKEWDFKQTPRNFWNLETGIETTKWLIEEELKWNDDEIKENLSCKVFVDNKLGGMLPIIFNNSPYEAINAAYPNRFKEWEFKNVPLNFWTLETGAKATKWLIEEKLKWNDEEIKEKLSIKTFKENNLYGMLQHIFNYSPYGAINAAYPNRFKKENLKSYQYNITKNK